MELMPKTPSGVSTFFKAAFMWITYYYVAFSPMKTSDLFDLVSEELYIAYLHGGIILELPFHVG
jgi:hypothetical protein